MIAYRSSQVRTVLLYAQDRQGLGHITRAVTIARHILASHRDVVVYLATRSQFAHVSALPERCDCIKLPSRQTPKHIKRPADDHSISIAHFQKLRGQILRDVALGLAPDLVLVDHEPLGASGEFREGLWALKEASPETRFVFGLRDIADDPERIRAEWRDMGVYEALEQLYDGIAVYGSPSLYDVAEAYDLPASVQPKLRYCGYIVRDPPAAPDPAAVRTEYGFPATGPLVLATVGSGYDGYPVLAGALTALERAQAKFPGLSAILVTGPFMPAEEQASLAARATPACRVVTRADTFQLMAVADAVVSMGGYNSVCEALASARPLVIVPRSTHKIEQQIRARILAAQGVARWVHPNELDGDALGQALEWALRCDPDAHARRVHEVLPSFDGAVQMTTYLSPWLSGARPAAVAPAPEPEMAADAAARLAKCIYAPSARWDVRTAQNSLVARLEAALRAFPGWKVELALHALSSTRAAPAELDKIRKLLDNVTKDGPN